jgi:hypothetical protein
MAELSHAGKPDLIRVEHLTKHFLCVVEYYSAQ